MENATHTVTVRREARLAYACCACGWRSSGCDTFKLAVRKGEQHEKETMMKEEIPPMSLTQWRKLRAIAEAGETRNPGNITTTMSLVVRGLVSADKHGIFPHAYMTYSVTERGKRALEGAPE